MKDPMNRLALSLFCALAASTAAPAQAQWIDTWYGPTWSNSYYGGWYGSYYSPSYTSYYGGCGWGGCGTSCSSYGCGSCGYSSYGCGSCGYGSCGTGSCYGLSSCGTGCSSYGCGSSCGYGCGTGCGYGCGAGCTPACGTGCSSYGLCSSLGCSPCVGSGCTGIGCSGINCSGNCNPNCNSNCNTGTGATDSRGNPTPVPDKNYDADPARNRGEFINPSRTLPMNPTYDSNDRGSAPARNSSDSDFKARDPMTPARDRLDDPLNRRNPPADPDRGGDMFDSDSHRTNKPTDEKPMDVPQRQDNPELNGPTIDRNGVPSLTASRTTTKRVTSREPGPRPSLDSKVTWRSVPERTRMTVRQTFATPVVARSQPATNSDWSPVKSETRVVRK